MTAPIKDSNRSHWVNRSPLSLRPYLQLSRLDRPVGYWLLTLPGWIGLAFATLSNGFASSDLKWAVLILIGAIAMRGAGCTYNDIVDQDLDAQVERTALRPLPAGSVTTKQAWIWLFAQCAVGLIVLLCLPRLAQIISLCSIPLVAAYPFMKRITWWPQLWLGLTFNWAVLVAYAAKTGTVSLPLFILYAGLIFWTVGYDTIYACQDIEDDMKIGVKSTARRFGKRVKLGVGMSYFLAVIFLSFSLWIEPYEYLSEYLCYMKDSKGLVIETKFFRSSELISSDMSFFLIMAPFYLALFFQTRDFYKSSESKIFLKLFKSNTWAALVLIVFMISFSAVGKWGGPPIISDYEKCETLTNP